MSGTLYGVGIGPGDPMLLTLKAVDAIRTCPIIGIPAADTATCTAWNIALQAVPEMAEKAVICVPVPMSKEPKVLEDAYNMGRDAIAGALKDGKDVAFLNLGDPTLYGTYMVLHQKIRAMGLCAKLISGVPSICAVAAALNTPLGERSEAIHILPGSYPQEDFKKLAGTKVLMKSGAKLSDVKQMLAPLERSGDMTVQAVTNCSMADQAVYQSLAELPDHAGYFTTLIVKDKH